MCRTLKFFSLVLVFTCFIGLASKPAAAGSAPWTVRSVSGDAQFQKGDLQAGLGAFRAVRRRRRDDVLGLYEVGGLAESMGEYGE